ncbi:chaperone binding [Striga asiatica]|uniref:Chaperone binding n=1 Tax=Striga asiatica TaxID=4170 RepID=A0A5A7Q0M8_STRAF|nr:chaperone binding [Striga asiatica]
MDSDMVAALRRSVEKITFLLDRMAARSHSTQASVYNWAQVQSTEHIKHRECKCSHSTRVAFTRPPPCCAREAVDGFRHQLASTRRLSTSRGLASGAFCLFTCLALDFTNSVSMYLAGILDHGAKQRTRKWLIGEEKKKVKGHIDVPEFTFSELDDLQEHSIEGVAYKILWYIWFSFLLGLQKERESLFLLILHIEVKLNEDKDIPANERQRISHDLKLFLKPLKEILLQFEEELKAMQ